MTPIEDCCYRCEGCDGIKCRDNEPSPGEQGDLCASCWEAGVEEGRLRGRDYDAWAAL